MFEIKKEIEQIEKDREKGASELLYDAVLILRKLASKGDKEKVIEASRIIEKIRPTMVILKNYMIRIRKDIEKYGLRIIEKYPQKLKEMRRRTIENADFIKGCVITCSFSSLVNDVLSKPFIKKVIALKSEHKGISYGEKFKKNLGEKVEVIEEECLFKVHCDYGLIGADAVLKNGFIINGTPSLFLAEKCKMSGVPLYVITTLDRVSENLIPEEGFDKIPARFVKGFITENGTLSFEEFIKKAKLLFT